MKRAEWVKDLMVNSDNIPLGTPQFSVSKGSNFRYENDLQTANADELFLGEPLKHRDSVILAPNKPKKIPDNFESTQNPANLSEVASKILSIQNLFESSIKKIKNQYLQRERKLFEQIKNEDELQILIATRPEILEIPSKLSPSPRLTPEPRFIDDYRNNHSYKPQSQSSNREIRDSPNSIKFESSRGSELRESHLNISEKSFAETLRNKEKEIRRNYSEYYDRKIDENIRELDEQLNEAITETQADWENYWRERINDLIETLKEKENEINTYYEDNAENEAVSLKYKNIYEAKKREVIEKIMNKIEPRFRDEYLQRKPKTKAPQISKRDRDNRIMKLQVEIEGKQANKLSEEREYWKNELVDEVLEHCKQKVKEEQDLILLKKEKELKRQVNSEKDEVISRLLRESEEAVEFKLQKLAEDKDFSETEFKEQLKVQCTKEVQKEFEVKFRENARTRIRSNIDKELRRNLATRVEMEVKIRLEDKLYHEMNQEFELSHDTFRKKLENDQYSKLLSLEEQCENARSKETASVSEKSLQRIEKDLKITFLKKLDKLRTSLRKEYEEIFRDQITVTPI